MKIIVGASLLMALVTTGYSAADIVTDKAFASLMSKQGLVSSDDGNILEHAEDVPNPGSISSTGNDTGNDDSEEDGDSNLLNSANPESPILTVLRMQKEKEDLMQPATAQGDAPQVELDLALSNPVAGQLNEAHTAN